MIGALRDNIYEVFFERDDGASLLTQGRLEGCLFYFNSVISPAELSLRISSKLAEPFIASQVSGDLGIELVDVKLAEAQFGLFQRHCFAYLNGPLDVLCLSHANHLDLKSASNYRALCMLRSDME